MKKNLFLIAIVGAVLFALGFAGASFAKSPEAAGIISGVDSPWSALQAADTTDGPETEAFRGRKGGFGFDLRSYMEQALADAFGITLEELQAYRDAGTTLTDLAIEQGLTVAEMESKLESARTAAIDAALAAGDITQEQADEMQARMAEGKPAGDRKHDGPLSEYMDAAIAEAFGITVEELQALEDAGQTLKDLAIEQNLTVEEFQAKTEAARTAAIDAALADGAITQEQADLMKERLADGPHGGMDDGFGPGGHGGGRGGGPGEHGGGRGGHDGMFGPGLQPDGTAPTTPTGSGTNG